MTFLASSTPLKRTLQVGIGITLLVLGGVQSTAAQKWRGNDNRIDPISRDGYVGIGRSDPAVQLDVQNNLWVRGEMHARGDVIRFSEDRGLDYDPGTNAIYYNDYDNGRVAMLGNIGGNAWFNGNVGIGTSSPDTRIQIGEVDQTGSEFLTFGRAADGRAGMKWNRKGTIDGRVYMDGEERIRIVNDFGDAIALTGGYVGVGRSKPAVQLDVQNSLWVRDELHARGDVLRFSEDRGLDYDPEENAIYYNDHNNGRVAMLGDIGGDAWFKGNVRAREVIVEPKSDIPDYVFTEEYDLPTLKEVSAFIEEEGHLPFVPTAEEVEKNGLHLGEMDATLLRKVEELTLYAIEQKRRADSLSSRLSRQQTRTRRLETETEEQNRRIRALERQVKALRSALQQAGIEAQTSSNSSSDANDD